MSTSRIGAILTLSIWAIASLPLLRAQDDLPDGKGKDTILRLCTGCHGVGSITSQRLSKRGWSLLVDEMIGRGASGTDEEIGIVVDYLVSTFGKRVNVNSATALELRTVLALSEKESDAVVKYRHDNGAFKQIGDLLKIPGVDSNKIEGQQASIVF